MHRGIHEGSLNLSNPDVARPAPRATPDASLGRGVVLRRNDVPTRPPPVSPRL